MAKKKNPSNNDNAKAKNKENSGSVSVVLKIDLHCEGCAAKFVKAVLSIAGVESVKRLENDDLKKITVIGKVDPDELRQKVENKINRKVELISPVTKNQQIATVKDANKPVKFPVTTTVLKVSLHCRGCIDKIEKLVRKTDGFMEMSMDKNNDLVTVKGQIDVNKLTTALKDKLKKDVEIVQAKDISGGKKGKGVGGDRGGGQKAEGNKMEHLFYQGQGQGQGQYTYPQYMYPQYAYRPDYTYNYPPAPQMFNDENPNACLVM